MNCDWPGQDRGLSLGESVARWNAGTPVVLVRGSRGGLASVTRARSSWPVVMVLSFAERGDATWPDLDIVGSTRELWGEDAGRYCGRVLVCTRDGWLAVELQRDDPERLATYVLRLLSQALGQLPSAEEVRRMVAVDLRFGSDRGSAYHVVSLDPALTGRAA